MISKLIKKYKVYKYKKSLESYTTQYIAELELQENIFFSTNSNLKRNVLPDYHSYEPSLSSKLRKMRRMLGLMEYRLAEMQGGDEKVQVTKVD